MRYRSWPVLMLSLGLAACGGEHYAPPRYATATPRDIPGETKRAVDFIDDQVRFANNGVYNQFTWMTDGTFCYLTQSKAEIRKSCFPPSRIDAGSVAVRDAGGLGAPYDRVALSCRRAGCIETSSQLTSEFGPRGYRHDSAMSMPTRTGGGGATADALRRLLSLSALAGPPTL